MTDTLVPEESPQAPVPQRRSALGRLYHGETAIDFYGRRWIGLGISALLILITLVSLFTRGLNLSLEFEGGVLWEVPSETLTEDQARAILDDNGLDGANAKVQILTSNETGRSVEIQVTSQPDEVRSKVQAAFAEEVGVSTDEVATQLVSSSWGSSITEKAVRALIIFMVLVAAFIAWRLEWRMALAAIVAMVHDVLISVGVYSLLGFEVTPATVVAFLTILGYSLYDTIVVFDKVQDNIKRFEASRTPVADIVNVSTNQVLMRSINTSVAAILPVLSLLVLGSEILGAIALREFSVALLVGITTGAYSSIFIATPLLAVLKEREPRFKNLRGEHATGDVLVQMVVSGHAVSSRARRTENSDQTASAPSAPATASSLLTHPPRPRKKRRR